jgi:CheY-like chemotaxis protein
MLARTVSFPVAFSGANAVDLLTGLAWPVLVGLVIWVLLPSIREVIHSRGFSVKAGGMEISVQDASDQLAGQLDDLREQISAVKAQHGDVDSAPLGEGLRNLRTVLWVDDYPENNAFEMDALLRKQITVDQAASTREAVGKATSRSFDAIVTDMGREIDGEDAGLELLDALKEHNVRAPVIVYASATAVARTREAALARGAFGVTSSGTELLDTLARLGSSSG